MIEPVVGRVAFELQPEQIPHFQEMVRQQLLGDYELLGDCLAGREDPELRLHVSDRIAMARALADQVGLPENVDRRRSRRAKRQIPVFIRPTLILFLLVAIVTAIIQVSDHFMGHLMGFGALYSPIVAVASMRYGKRVGLPVAIGCVMGFTLASLKFDPDFGLDLRILALSTGLLLLAWVTRREAIIAWIDARRSYWRGA